MSRHTEPMTDAAIKALRRRTHARLLVARLEMGAAWLLHPDHPAQGGAK